MRASRRVRVCDDDDVRASQVLRVLVPPLASATRVAGSDAAGTLDRLDVLLPLADVDRLAGGCSFDDLREPVEDTLGVAQVVRPAPLRLCAAA